MSERRERECEGEPSRLLIFSPSFLSIRTLQTTSDDQKDLTLVVVTINLQSSKAGTLVVQLIITGIINEEILLPLDLRRRRNKMSGIVTFDDQCE